MGNPAAAENGAHVLRRNLHLESLEIVADRHGDDLGIGNGEV
jgi:hypothetical protein